MPLTREQLERRIKINKNDLDTELVEQADLYYNAGIDYVQKMSEAAYLSELGDKVRAKLDQAVRESHADDEKKPTETAIKAEIDAHPDWRKHVSKALEANKARDFAQALKEAYQQRSYALKDLAALYMAQYYSTDSVTENNKHAREANLRSKRREALKAAK